MFQASLDYRVNYVLKKEKKKKILDLSLFKIQLPIVLQFGGEDPLSTVNTPRSAVS